MPQSQTESSGGTMSPTARDNAPVHDEDVLKWRQEAWRKLGFNAEWSDFLATTQMDLHTAQGMLEQGATQDQVVQILAGYGPLGEDPMWRWDAYNARMHAEIEAAAEEEQPAG